MKTIFITGASGYMGTRLAKRLLKRGHHVKALVRKGSEHKLPAGCEVIIGNPFDDHFIQNYLSPSDIFVQLLGYLIPLLRKRNCSKL